MGAEKVVGARLLVTFAEREREREREGGRERERERERESTCRCVIEHLPILAANERRAEPHRKVKV